MRSSILKIILFSLIAILAACSPEHSQIVVAEYGDQELKMEDFEKAYAKNVGGFEEAKDDSVKQLKDFLDLYVNYLMKLKDSKLRRYQDNEDVIKELNDYKKRVGVSYIKEKLIAEPKLKELYEKRKTEWRMSHIMITFQRRKKDAAKKMAENLMDSLKAGADFGELAKKYSEDNFSKNRDGDIYYLISGQILKELEVAADSTPVGEIYPEPIETSYGYHIIKVTDRQPRTYKVNVSHILIGPNGEDGKPDTVAALAKAQSIRDSILAGADFAEMAKRYSIDKGTAAKGGQLPDFDRKKMVFEFDEAAFNLKEGEISDIVKTRYGYHILKLNKIIEHPSFEEEKDHLKKLYDKYYYKKDEDAYVAELRKEFDYKVNEEAIAKAGDKMSKLAINNYEGSPQREEVKDIVFLTIDSTNYKADEIILHGNAQPKNKNKMLRADLLNEVVKDFGTEKLLEDKSLVLDQQDSVFAGLMEDYKNGIFIFRLQEEEVWQKLELDSLEIKAYYDSTKSRYLSKDKVEFQEIFKYKEDEIKDIYNQLKDGANFDTLASQKTERLTFRKTAGKFPKMSADNDDRTKAAFALENEGDLSEPFKYENGWCIVKLTKKYPSRVKTFDEARAEVTSAYQEKMSKKLENEYLKSLKELYKPEYNYDVLPEAFKKSEDQQ